MIVPAMNKMEIKAEIKRDLAKICKSTLPRLAAEYDRERRKLKIEKSNDYSKIYCIKTGSKNKWMIFVKKAAAKTKYLQASDATYFTVVYYYTKDGFNACRINGANEDLEFFYGHFFSRYNERQQLNLPDTLSAVKHFFNNNEGFNTLFRQLKKEAAPKGTTFVESVCDLGLALGLYYLDTKHIIYKTFISKHLLTKSQRLIEEELKETYCCEETDDEVLTTVAA